MDKAPLQVLVCGEVKGRFDELFSRITEMMKQTPISFLICLGRFFGDDLTSFKPYLNSQKVAPVKTYFLCPMEQIKLLDPSMILGGEVCKNIHNLGKIGLREINGLNVGYCTYTEYGNIDQKAEIERYVATRFDDKRFKGIDIFLTNDWPKGTLKSLNGPQLPQHGLSLFEYDDFGSPVVSELVSQCVPRYHFAASLKKHVFYERPPYKNGPQFAEQRNCHVTRFLSLANAFNTQKRRFIYAFKIEPLNGMDPTKLYAEVEGSTEFPFKAFTVGPPTKKQKTEAEQKEEALKATPQAAFDALSAKPAYATATRTRDGHKAANRGPGCWFCISNPKVEQHLIVNMGIHFYLALAKGAMTDTHVLLVPVKHMPTVPAMERAAMTELHKWKTSLTNFFENYGQIGIFWEHNQTPKDQEMQHCHVQAIGLPKANLARVRQVFEDQAANSRLEWLEVKVEEDFSNLQKQILAGHNSYFWVHLPGNINLVGMIGDRFPFSFGRRVVANILGYPQLEDWKNCVQTTEQEETLTVQLRKDFQPFNISLKK